MKFYAFIILTIGLLIQSCSDDSTCPNEIRLLDNNLTVCLSDSTWKSDSDSLATYLTKYSDSTKPIFVFMIKQDFVENDWTSEKYRELQLEEYNVSLTNFKLLDKGELNSMPYSEIQFDMIREDDTILANSKTLFYKKGDRAIVIDSWYLEKDKSKIDFLEIENIWKSIEIE